MLGKRLIKTSAGAACTTDTVQILDGVPFQSIATYELDGDATNLVDTGYIGKAGVFNGSSSQIVLGSAVIPSDNFSISMWVNSNDVSTQNNLITQYVLAAGSNGRFVFVIDGGYFQAYVESNGSGTNFNYVLSNNTWYHVTIVKSGSWECFVNGTSVGTWSDTVNITTSYNTQLGSRVSSTNALNGKLDQVRIFNKALSSSEVTTLYGETSASSTKSTTDIFGDSSGISLYEFEGNANDTGGTYNGTATNVVYNEYDGTASNVTYSTGKFGQAGVFNGSSSKIDYPSSIIPSTGGFSISWWMKWNGDSDYAFLFDTAGGGGTNGFYCIVHDAVDTVYWNFKNGSYGTNISVSYPVAERTEWTHFVITWDGTTSPNAAKIYKNKVATSGTQTVTQTTSGQNFKLGYTGVEYFNGSIDQVRIYDRAISAADVTTLYNETVATASTNPTFNVPSLVAYYKMNDATDETGSYDGTPTNVNFNVAGKFGNAGEFNGSSSKINIPQTYGAEGEQFSYSLWFNTSVADGSYMFAKRNGNNTFHIRIDNSFSPAGKICVNNWAGTAQSANNAQSTAGGYNDNNWHHFVFTYDGTRSPKTQCYIDGVRDTNMNWDYDLISQTISNGNNIGNYDLNGANFSGKIDQVRIFDKAITSDEVTKLYNEVYCQPTIVPTDHFEPVIYTGNGSTQSITSLNFEPDFTWIKIRTLGYNHYLIDSVRGATEILQSNLTDAESTQSTSLTSFDTNGFTVGSKLNVNANTEDFVSWNWKAGGAAVAAGGTNLTNRLVSANPDAGFSIMTYTGATTDGTIEHGLNAKPELWIFKNRSASKPWFTLTNIIDGSVDYGFLNTTDQFNNAGQSDATDTVLNVNNDGASGFLNASGNNYVAYAFHSVDGMSKIGSYVGTGAASNSIVTGFRPAYVMIKRTSASGSSWAIFDNKRGVGEPSKVLYANLSDSEYSDNLNDIEFSSNGFTLLDNNEHTNYSSNTYIFMAFAEENVEPQPVLANSFNTVTYTGNGSTQAINTVGFQPDLVWIKQRSGSASHSLQDSVRGAGQNYNLYSDNTAYQGQYGIYGYLSSFDTNGFSVAVGSGSHTNANGSTYVAWNWKASNESTINQEGSITSIVSANPAAGFSVVKYTGTGVSGSYGHGLLSAPELIITKNIDWSTPDWFVYHKDLAVNGYLRLNQTTSEQSASTIWASAPSTTVVNIGNDSGVNRSTGDTQIAYCFHSVDGYQSVGSYTSDNQTTKNISVGFRPSFLLLKRTNGASNWALVDDLRGSNELYANTSGAEAPEASIPTFYDDGFTLHNTRYNGGTDTYIYLAIA